MHMVWVFCLFAMVLYVSINISEALDIRAGNDVIKGKFTGVVTDGTPDAPRLL